VEVLITDPLIATVPPGATVLGNTENSIVAPGAPKPLTQVSATTKQKKGNRVNRL
jgi:hypothetical protein